MAKVGIAHNGIEICAMSFSDRKKPCLCVCRGNEIIVIGTFNNAGCVDEWEKALRQLLGKEGANENEGGSYGTN